MTAPELQLTLWPERYAWGAHQRRRSRPARPAPDGRGRHGNSLDAEAAARPRLNARALHILAWMVGHAGPGLTDRQVRDGFAPGQDMDYVRPRITELVDAALLFEVDKIIDPVSGVRVRRTAPTADAYTLIHQRKS